MRKSPTIYSEEFKLSVIRDYYSSVLCHRDRRIAFDVMHGIYIVTLYRQSRPVKSSKIIIR